MLKAHGVETLADVRRVPRSRYNPQFNRESLPGDLSAEGIRYVHMPGLGGLRHPRPDSPNRGWTNPGFRGYADFMQTGEFQGQLDALLGLEGCVAIMCAEAVPWRCHRSLIADALTARGVEVFHILGATRVEGHRLTSFARLEGTRVTYPSDALDLFPE